MIPAEPAAKKDLIRRAYYDLIGLPPKPAEVDAFVKSTEPKAYEKLIDQLLASPRYGERWGRYWLDLVRYAESDGYKTDDYRPNAYKYRDYVISSFNQDKSYQRFVLEQLAGDEFDPQNPDALVATHFYRLPVYEWDQRDAIMNWDNITTDITDVTGDVFLGQSIQCAKCHNHKFDPILQKDYFALKGFFKSMSWRDDMPLNSIVEQKKYNAWKKSQKTIFDAIKNLEKAARKANYDKAIKMFPDNIQAIAAKPITELSTDEKQVMDLVNRQIKREWDYNKENKALEKKRQSLLAKLSPPPVQLKHAATVHDVGPAGKNIIPGKGNQNILPGFLTVLYPKNANVNARVIKPQQNPKSTGRRLALAKWITDPKNPLTTRVIVNRIWQYHFSKALTDNPNDLGRLSKPPTHPELLDWLTNEFIKNGWRFKHMHKLIMMSKTYQQASTNDNIKANLLIDPDNKFLWRMDSRRLDAEALRDSILQMSSELTHRTGGPSLDKNSPYRSVYLKVVRNKRHEFLHAFDAADSYYSTAVRNITTTPIQSLFMINSKWTLERANVFGIHLFEQFGDNHSALINHLYKKVYGRLPNQKELSKALNFIAPKKQEGEIAKELNAFSSTKLKNGKSALAANEFNSDILINKSVPLLTNHDNFSAEFILQLNDLHKDDQPGIIMAQKALSLEGLSWQLIYSGKIGANEPGTIMLKLSQKDKEEVLLSNLQIQTGIPYFIGFVFKKEKDKSTVKFYIKNLSDKKATLRQDTAYLATFKEYKSSGQGILSLFSDGTASKASFRLSELRLSKQELSKEQLLINNATLSVLMHSSYEPKLEAFKDKSEYQHSFELFNAPNYKMRRQLSYSQKRIVDLCHILFNSNEFLYLR